MESESSEDFSNFIYIVGLMIRKSQITPPKADSNLKSSSMSSCCSSSSCQGASRFFSRFAKRYAKSFRKKGLEKVQKYLLEGVRLEPVASKSIIDIGCGVGSLHLTLLREGASHAVGFDLAEEMINQAKAIASELALENKVEYRVGDFVVLTNGMEETDITMLDKVVCCYEDVNSLLEKSLAKTKGIYALSHPRNNALHAFVWKSQIAFMKLIRAKFYPFWHDWDRLRQRVLDQDFEEIYSNQTVIWQVRVFRKLQVFSNP